MSNQTIKAILFDMDNTLIDWSSAPNWQEVEAKHLQLVLDYLHDRGRPLNATLNHFSQTFREMAGDAWAEARTTLRAPHLGRVLLRSLGRYGFMPDDDISIHDCLIAYAWNAVEGVEVFPDVPPALEKLLALDIKIGIVTNAFQPMKLREAELESFGLLQYFPDAKTRISAADVGYLKPHENIFYHALEAIEEAPEQCLYVGDNPVADIAGSQAVGMRGVLRVNNEIPPMISGLIVPDAAINSFDELLMLVEDWDQYTA